MSYVPLTQDGKAFIRHIGNSTQNNGLITGGNSYPLPYASSNVYNFTAKAYDHNNKLITSNTQLCESLIVWFDKYSKIYDLDANIIAAQAIAESGFKIWNYSETGAMGLTQFTMTTVYDVLISNNYSVTPKFSDDEIGKITSGVTDLSFQTSYFNSDSSNANTRAVAKSNRLIVHQNIIDNPEIMIKAQCRLMKKIAQNNQHWASSTLFLYNRASGISSKSYTDAIIKVDNMFKGTYINEGLKYVKHIFGLLGDKNNKYAKGDHKGYSFGYDTKIDIDPNNFDSFVADQNNGY